MNRYRLLFLFVLFLSILVSGANAQPLKVCLVSGSAEYDSDTCLTVFKKYLESHYDVKCTLHKAIGFHDLPGLEALDQCDVALFYTRRLVIDGEQLERIKAYCEAGRPIVAIRTASHGFQNWLEMDKLVYGGNYHNHYGNLYTQDVKILPDAKDHPILDGVEQFRSPYSLYKTGPLADDVTVLTESLIVTGETEASSWVREYKGGRVFYTQMGGLSDFENASFQRMVANALFWAARRDVRRLPSPEMAERPKPSGNLHLRLRSRVKAFKGTDSWDEVFFERDFPVAETAIIICDMWDRHWCKGATERCEAIALKMNPVIQAARDSGIQIVHAPSDTLGFYADWLQRKRIRSAPEFPLPEPLEIPDHPLPIDDSDGGCDTGDQVYWAWTRQSGHIDIGEFDGISDNGREIYNFFRQEGIKNVIVMGVHTNMCVLGRSFAIRQMSRWGFQCVLVRDLTDTMYDPGDYPFVEHGQGTELVVEHIEKYWCPSILSAELVEGLP